jgi:Transposase C of IS166 homeodomain
MDAAPDDIIALRVALEKAQARAAAAEAETARAVAQASSIEALIASLRLEIAKLRRELYGQRSERKARLLEQLEFQLEELEATASEDELAAEQATAKTTVVKAFTRQRSSRKPFPVPGSSTPRACRRTRPEHVRLLRIDQTGQVGRDHHRDPGKHSAPVEGNPDGAGEVHLSGLREDHPATGAVPYDPARLGRPQPAGHDPVREVRSTPASQPAVRTLRP